MWDEGPRYFHRSWPLLLLLLFCRVAGVWAQETQQADWTWAKVVYPASAVPGQTIDLEVVVHAGPWSRPRQLMVGLHRVDAQGRRHVEAATFGPFAVEASGQGRYVIQVTLPSTSTQYWALPIWLSEDGRWQGGNPHAAEIHVGARMPESLRCRAAGTHQPMIFTERQPVEVVLRQPSFKPVKLKGELRQVEGNWAKQIELDWPAEQTDLTLGWKDLPGRGLYEAHFLATGKNGAFAQGNTRFAVVFEPPPSTADSRWGIFTIAFDDAARDLEIARGHRRLGASWSRLNLWPWPPFLEKVKVSSTSGHSLEVQIGRYQHLARALRQEGIFVMGQFAGMPQPLSRRPDDAGPGGVDGPRWSRYAPQDWELWEAFVREVVRQSPEVTVWQIWNEPTTRSFWLENAEVFGQMIKRTAHAIKQANPQAQVSASGFTSATDQMQVRDLLRQGIDAYVDIYSFHASRKFAGQALEGFPAAAAKPLWHTEVHQMIPVDALAFDRMFHFLYRGFATWTEQYPVLIDSAGLPTRWACGYATAVQVIGQARLVESHSMDTGELGILRRLREDGSVEQVALWKSQSDGLVEGRIQFQVKPLSPTQPVQLLDIYGRVLQEWSQPASITVPIRGLHFLRGASELSVRELVAPKEPPDPLQYVFPAATHGRTSGGWQRFNAREGVEPRNHHGAWLFYSGDSPAWVEVDVEVPRAGLYQVFYLGISTATIDPAGVNRRWNSPFAWSFNGQAKTVVDRTSSVMFARTTRANLVKGQRLNTEQARFAANADTYELLGVARLPAGKSVFRLELLEPRPLDGRYTAMFEAVVLRPVDP